MTFSLDTISADMQAFVVSPIAAFGLAGFLFDIESEAQVQLQADITDHYTEDNRALQDHIAIKPKRVTLRGYVGEVVYKTSDKNGFVNKMAQKLTSFSSYLPKISSAATQLQSINATGELPSFDTALKTGSDLYGLTKNLLNANGKTAKQTNAYNYFRSLMQQGVLTSIQTPWEYMTNMAIESIMVVQGEDSTSVSEFEIRYKEIRIAKTKTTPNKKTEPTTLLDKAKSAVSDFKDSVMDKISGLQRSVTNSLGMISGSTSGFISPTVVQEIFVKDLQAPSIKNIWSY
jgi:hypothetical protein